MPRKLRVEYEGAVYHVLNRGDRRESIFLGDEDRALFLETLGEVCGKTGWQVHALCLMNNHFHLVLEAPRANLIAGMRWFLGTSTARFNRRHKFFGHLFSGRTEGWTEKELVKRRKGDKKKARMAMRLRAETTMSWTWITKRLGMGHWRTASNAVRLCLKR